MKKQCEGCKDCFSFEELSNELGLLFCAECFIEAEAEDRERTEFMAENWTEFPETY